MRSLKDRFGRLAYLWTGARATGLTARRTRVKVDGKKWFNPSDRGDRLPAGRDGWIILADDSQRRRLGKRVDYRVDVKGIDTTTLFFAGVPEALNLSSASLIRTPQDNYRVGAGTADGVRYAVRSFFEDGAPNPESLGVEEIPAAAGIATNASGSPRPNGRTCS